MNDAQEGVRCDHGARFCERRLRNRAKLSRVRYVLQPRSNHSRTNPEAGRTRRSGGMHESGVAHYQESYRTELSPHSEEDLPQLDPKQPHRLQPRQAFLRKAGCTWKRVANLLPQVEPRSPFFSQLSGELDHLREPDFRRGLPLAVSVDFALSSSRPSMSLVSANATCASSGCTRYTETPTRSSDPHPPNQPGPHHGPSRFWRRSRKNRPAGERSEPARSAPRSPTP